MRITEDVETITVIKETKGIVCNSCGEVFTPNDNEFYSVQKINLSFGYDSKFDNQSWGLDICEDCLLKIIKGFKVVPENFMSDPSYISSFDSDPELHQKLFDEWKMSNEWNYEEENPYENYYKEEYREDKEEEVNDASNSTNLKLVK